MAGTKVKSPHYPIMNLEAAVGRARDLATKIGRGPVSRDAAIAALGLSPKSSTGQRTMAAVLSFGLWEKVSKGQVRLSERGRRIVAAPDLKMAAKELGEAALMPKIHRRVLQQWPEGLPADDAGMLGFLRMEWDFHPDSAAPFIRQVRETFAFAKVYENATLPPDVGDEDEDDEAQDDPEQGRGTQPLEKPAAGKPAGTAPDRQKRGGSMEVTSWNLKDGGRIVLEAPMPLPSGYIRKLASIDDAIREHLGDHLSSDPVPEPDAP